VKVFFCINITSTVFHQKEILMRGSTGPGNMTGLTSDEVNWKFFFIFFKLTINVHWTNELNSLKKVLCLLDENKIPNVELVVEFVGFTYANITFDQKLDSTFDLGIL
jgi:hypothetical protein